MTLDLMDTMIFSAELSEGRSLKYISAGNGVAYVTGIKVSNRNGKRYAAWTPEEDFYLRDHLGWNTEEEIAVHLGRTRVAVHLRWKRDLHLPAPSRHPDYITANQAAELVGLDAHKIAHWCDVGLIPVRVLPSARHIRMILRVSFDRWIVSPSNWIYFDWKRIPDRRLRRLCALRAKRWGDQWWTTVQVAKFHGVTSKDVLRLITIAGTIPAVQVATSIGGRHKNPYWLNWFVRKSDAVKAVFMRGRGCGNEIKFSRRAEAWMLNAHTKLGLSYEAIRRSMGSPCDGMVIKKNIVRLLKKP